MIEILSITERENHAVTLTVDDKKYDFRVMGEYE